jgi:hypothetical protein
MPQQLKTKIKDYSNKITKVFCVTQDLILIKSFKFQLNLKNFILHLCTTKKIILPNLIFILTKVALNLLVLVMHMN